MSDEIEGYEYDRRRLRAIVATMRELGVREYDGIKLGPPPSKPLPPKAPPTQRQLDDYAVARVKYEEAYEEWASKLDLAHVEDPGPEPVAPEPP